MMLFSRLALLIFVALVPPIFGYGHFRDRIPNGHRVPNPCKPNEIWDGVGHFNEAGGGFRNPFGLDFYAEEKAWTEALCRKDSDGDGKTNGQELGDSNCMWRPSSVPEVTSGLSHPGVCEPLDSPACQQRNFSVGPYRVQKEWMADACKSAEFVCDGLGDPAVKNVTFKLNKTKVPARETTYMCAVFDFPEPESDVHLIATTPILDNRQVIHHMLLFGCTGEVNRTRGEAYACNMAPDYSCLSLISAWTLGLNGDCSHNNTGIRLGGAKGFRTFAIQLHWNNPEESSNYTDSSGMVLYYTSNMRKYDASILWLGNIDFEIPPRQPLVSIEATCTAACTRSQISNKIYVVKAINHMHYLGVSQSVAQYRNGSFLRNITYDEAYSYDSPKLYDYLEPIEVLPGDELKTTCQFNSMNRDKTTTFGESTQQEMCFGFLNYYPASALSYPYCLSYRSGILLAFTKSWLENAPHNSTLLLGSLASCDPEAATTREPTGGADPVKSGVLPLAVVMVFLHL